MPVQRCSSGERFVQADVEVPGSPEDVWNAIATGQGMSSWFVPSTSDERVGGKAINNFGPEMESVASITEWDPPHRFIAETNEGPGTVATEWSVESRSGGNCVVRVLHRWFSDTDDWDREFEGHTDGWQSFFRILRLYLAHFARQPGASFQLSEFSQSSAPEVWSWLKEALGIRDADSTVTPSSGAPALLGCIENAGTPEHPELLLRLERPAPGLAHMFVMPMGDHVMLSIRFYLYGESSVTAARDIEREWTEWLETHFPS